MNHPPALHEKPRHITRVVSLNYRGGYGESVRPKEMACIARMVGDWKPDIHLAQDTQAIDRHMRTLV